MTRFVLAAILVVTSTLVASNVATAASNPEQPQREGKAASVSMPDFDFTQFRYADNSSHPESKPVPFEVAQGWVTNVCYTAPGWCYVPPAPVGTPCSCYFNGLWYPGSH